MKNLPLIPSALAIALLSTSLHAAQDSELQDMSDPLAVFSQAGVGYTDKGINLKFAQAYDSGKENILAMRALEVKGIYGDTLGWHDGVNTDDSVDFIRFRSFEVDTTTGTGAQLDVNFNLDGTHLAEESGDVSYSIMQALPALGPLNFYPLAGIGATFGNNTLEDDGRIDSGYSVLGTYYQVGMYSKLTITEDIWINYNPFYASTLSGADVYKNHAYGENNDSILLHELALSYQINPRLNVRYFANWNEYVDFDDGDHRIEVNYQF